LDIGAARKQDRQQRIFLRTGVIDLIDDALRALSLSPAG